MGAEGYWEQVTAVFGAVEAANQSLGPVVAVLNANPTLVTDRGWRASALDALITLSVAAEACLTIPAPLPGAPPHRESVEHLQTLLHELGSILNAAAKAWHVAATSEDPSEIALAVQRIRPASDEIARTVERINDELDFFRLRLQLRDL